jgi:Fe2+ or Zn2+ uptake regulation protein
VAIRKSFDVFCEKCGCWEYLGIETGMKLARKLAKVQGYKFDRKDGYERCLCDRCSKEMGVSC